MLREAITDNKEESIENLERMLKNPNGITIP
jgi:hypothetical protein